MKTRIAAALLVPCVAAIFGAGSLSAAESGYKLREAEQYVKDRNGEPIPHVYTSEHFAIKWGKLNNKNATLDEKFAKDALAYFESMRKVYKDEVGLPLLKSEAGKFKNNIYVTETGLKPFESGYAFGFPDAEGYGVFTGEPSIMRPGHAAAAHELGHATQGESGNFRDSDYVGWFWECHAQFMAQQVGKGKFMPESLDLYVDMSRFDWGTAVAWHQYSGWLFLQYLKEKPGYGYPAVNSLWTTKATFQDEDPVRKLIRIQKLDHDKWADLFGDYARRNVTFASYQYGKEYKAALDKVRPRNIARSRHNLEAIKGQPGWYRIPYAIAPLQHGYNVVPLTPTAKKVSVTFNGMVDEYRGSDWRVTMVVVNDKGGERFSNTWNSGTQSVQLKPGENQLYVVVAAIPKVFNPIKFLQDYRTQEKFPYTVKIEGATPKGAEDKVTPPAGVEGAPHSNGGGFVASTAKVDATAYVGPNAMVLGTAQVAGEARVEDYAVVSGSAKVSGDAVVGGHAMVTDNAQIGGYATVKGWAQVYDNSVIDENAWVFEYPRIQGAAHIHGNAVVRGSSNVSKNILGTATFIGAATSEGDVTKCERGIYSGYCYQGDADKGREFGGLVARYPFDVTHSFLAKDVFAGSDGYIVGKPEWVADRGKGKALSFNGRNQYVEMPSYLTDMIGMQITTWVKWEGGAPGQRIFDFGRNSGTCMYLTPSAAPERAGGSAGNLQFVIRKDRDMQAVNADSPLPVGKWCKVSVGIMGGKAQIFVDDQLAGESAVTMIPEDLKSDSNFLARGQEGGYFNGQIDDVEILREIAK